MMMAGALRGLVVVVGIAVLMAGIPLGRMVVMFGDGAADALRSRAKGRDNQRDGKNRRDDLFHRFAR